MTKRPDPAGLRLGLFLLQTDTTAANLALPSVAFPGTRERNRATAAWSTVTGIALVREAGWRAVFWLNVPIGVTALVLTFAVRESADRHPRGVDVPGQVLAAAFLSLLTYAIAQTGVVPGVVAAVAGVAFLLAERREHAMLPPGPPSSRCSCCWPACTCRNTTTRRGRACCCSRCRRWSSSAPRSPGGW